MEIIRQIQIELERVVLREENFSHVIEEGIKELSLITLRKLFEEASMPNTQPFITDNNMEEGYFLPLIEIKFGLRCDGRWDATLVATLVAKAKVLLDDKLQPKTP